MALPQDTYFEFSLVAPQKGAHCEVEAYAFFKRARVLPSRVVLTIFRTQRRWSFYTRQTLELKKVLAVYGHKPPLGLKSKVRTLGPKDWRDRWQIYFHTMPLGRSFTIVPLWEKKAYKTGSATKRTPLFLDPCGAFGSGGHETTRLMIRLMEPLAGQLESFFDIGTGTGILTVAAYHLGARRIEGIDIDRFSVSAARNNFRLNECRRGVFKRQNILDRKETETFNGVAANFISSDLLACEKAILKRVSRGGYLLLSGISMRNLPEFLKSFKASGFKRIKLIRGRSWAGLLYQKN